MSHTFLYENSLPGVTILITLPLVPKIGVIGDAWKTRTAASPPALTLALFCPFVKSEEVIARFAESQWWVNDWKRLGRFDVGVVDVSVVDVGITGGLPYMCIYILNRCSQLTVIYVHENIGRFEIGVPAYMNTHTHKYDVSIL